MPGTRSGEVLSARRATDTRSVWVEWMERYPPSISDHVMYNWIFLCQLKRFIKMLFKYCRFTYQQVSVSQIWIVPLWRRLLKNILIFSWNKPRLSSSFISTWRLNLSSNMLTATKNESKKTFWIGVNRCNYDGVAIHLQHQINMSLP